MPLRPSSELPADLPVDLDALKRALAKGRRHFAGLRLGDLDGVALDLGDCDLHGGCFKEGRFGHARLAGANVEAACFQQALLWGADLSDLKAGGSFWHDADLSSARLQGADFSAALMHRCCLRGVLGAHSRWRSTRLVEADFRGGLDQRTDLGWADFQGADLSFAQMQGALLQGSDLRGACLYGTNMGGADLRDADLRGCDLRDTDLRDAMLEGTLLHDALLP
ncbi:pentapeptide repeat-containing protein [Cyanobium gracile UHCC 0139]|uniref:Pentapeptide repeat-containing protein n=1 Tax=Cyanobium gracile UHCC 0139 TaxID=3110308 RepID=A0ABU5RXW8_9CYAN|nr:pentapeptide repeat-containing protein [Cyanobium gracile]MEA5392556.1 pentapeptide repeat-containing protein [Cyanobium gracile UHCC 0139]